MKIFRTIFSIMLAVSLLAAQAGAQTGDLPPKRSPKQMFEDLCKLQGSQMLSDHEVRVNIPGTGNYIVGTYDAERETLFLKQYSAQGEVTAERQIEPDDKGALP